MQYPPNNGRQFLTAISPNRSYTKAEADAKFGGGSSPLTTKGDVFTYTSANARLPVGSNGQILSADSTQATGLKWIPSTGSPGGSDTQIQFNDGGSAFGGSTKFTFVKSNGAITIGDTTGSTGNFIVRSSAVNNMIMDVASDTSAASAPFYVVRRYGGTIASPTIITAGYLLGGFVGYGYDGATQQLGGYTTFTSEAGVAAGSMPTTFLVAVSPNGSVTPATAFTITSTKLATFSGVVYASSTFELGNASDTTLSRSSAGVLAVEGVVVDTVSAANTLTNKRITKRVVTAADATSVTPNTDNADITYQLNTQSTGTLTINADGGTPTDGQSWMFRIKSTNVQTFSWNAVFEGGTVALPTTSTGSSKIDMYTFSYSTVNSKWMFTGQAPGFA